MQITNEMDMFEYIKSLAEQGTKEQVSKTEFLKGIEELKKSLFIVKMREEGNNLIFTKMFDSVSVTMREVGDDLFELKYRCLDFMEQFRNHTERELEEFRRR